MTDGRDVVGTFEGFATGDLILLGEGAASVGGLMLGFFVVIDGALVVGFIPGNFVGALFDGSLPMLCNVGDFVGFARGIDGVAGAFTVVDGAFVGFMPGIFVDAGDFMALGILLDGFLDGLDTGLTNNTEVTAKCYKSNTRNENKRKQHKMEEGLTSWSRQTPSQPPEAKAT
jgi:hypothetical protein